ncbi:hypothetical protein P4S93_09780 [Aneurinibacillus thermoaerophilus]|uniref:YD repeat-containing protein n=1 Tax=Aneurinibacillus thermoaerophilus TaxID=143495 RepID=A0A1G8EP82_ANETH|nr:MULTISPECIES: hypothetical protein [Aneurinibacillus]AMA72939.1 hypothetical protein ACH33_08750 [Aneurinibacillus sp. XH2]MED0758678.1 hypothetical protein [Aneurinibacillus thermoaerophilus]MED0761068.1 hypothetical protein [Aneurinibacillus thermoaerophilus]SDH71658.1 YD repeat-containing protein [Aneurinibacillus thermoaerophilus]
MASNTPNLGLYMKDPVTDGNHTFNIETMLNENWRKIDEKVVLKEEGKGLSTNDYTDADKQKLANMQEGSINQDTADARYLQAGSTNQDVTFSKSIIQQTDTRSVFLTYTNGDLTKVEEKDGTTVVKTTDLTYSSGKLTQVVETVGGKTITQTLNYDESGNLQSVTRSVV